MYALASQPQSIGKILDSGVKLYVAGFKKFIILSLVGGFAGVAPQLLGVTTVDPSNPQGMPDPATFIGLMVFSLAVGLTIMAAIIYRLGGVAAGRETTLGQSIALGLKRLLPLIVAWILYAIALLVGLALLVIPGLIVMITLSFFAAAMVLDGEGPVSGLKRSHNLAWGSWWRITIVYTIPSVIIMVLYFAIMMVFGTAIGLGMPADPAEYELMLQTQLYLNIAVGAMSALLSPLYYAIMITLYHDLKMRKEGGDIAARMASATA